MDPLEVKLRIRIKAFIEENNLTQQQFARAVDCQPTQLSMFLRGHRSPTLDFVERSRDVMGITLGDLDAPGEIRLEVELLKGKLGRLLLENPVGFRLVNQTIDALMASPAVPSKKRRRDQDE
jgi:transcriptional regulator with XRE-family HTH domain